MAFKTNTDEDISKGLFNEAGFIVKRLHALQDEINKVRSNLLAWNEDKECWNYQIFFNNLKSIVSEIWSKLTDEERKELLWLKGVIRDVMKAFPVYEKKQKLNPPSVVTTLNTKNWDKLEEFLEMYERNINDAKEAHGFSNPDMEGDDLF